MNESRTRSLIKAISWRVFGTLSTMLIVFIFTHKVILSFYVGLFEFISKVGLFYIHERMWMFIRLRSLINFFKKNEPIKIEELIKMEEPIKMEEHIKIEEPIKKHEISPHFLVTSHGQTASMWLAAVLNRIPEVFCSHGYSYPPQPAELRELSNEDYTLRHTSAERFEKLSLDDYFQELKSATSKPYAGNVLAFYLGRLLTVAGTELKEKKIKVVNLVRHPVTRVTSTLKTWNYHGDENHAPDFVKVDFNTRCDHIINFLAKSHPVNFLNLDNQCFIVALLAMEDIARDVNLAKEHEIINLRYEDLTKDKTHFKNFVAYITHNRVELSDEILNEIFLSKKINTHNNTSISEADKQFQSWEAWKQDAFKFIMQKNNIAETYADFGYDFSFVK